MTEKNKELLLKKCISIFDIINTQAHIQMKLGIEKLKLHKSFYVEDSNDIKDEQVFAERSLEHLNRVAEELKKLNKSELEMMDRFKEEEEIIFATVLNALDIRFKY